MFDSERPFDPAELPLERLEHEITELAAHINAGSCRWLELIAEFDRREGWGSWGCRSCAEWVAWQCAVTPRAAREHIRVARCLEELPLIHEEFARGRLSYSKVRALTRVAEPDTEEDLIELATHATAAQLERVVRGLRRVSSEEADEHHANRYLVCWWEDDGSLSVRGQLPPEDAALFLKALDASHDRLREFAPPPGSGSAEPPPHPRQTHADAFVAMAETSLSRARAGPEDRFDANNYQVMVHVDASTLSHDARGQVRIADGPALAPESRGGLPAIPPWSRSSNVTGQRSASAARPGRCRPRCEERSRHATAAAASRAASAGASSTPTTSGTGRTAARPARTTW